MRLFLALTVDEPIRRELAVAVEELKRSPAKVGWVRPDAMHLTLKFLGETAGEKIPALTESLRRSCAAMAPFSFEVAGLGAFPPRGKPRVIWAGVKEYSGRMAHLAGTIEDIVAGLGWKREKRPFSPHLTLGRVRGEMFLEGLSKAVSGQGGRAIGTQKCGRLVLFQSHLENSGARYEEMATFPFLDS